MRNYKQYLWGLLLLLSLQQLVSAQGVAINTDGSDADVSAILDVSSTERGMLVPRINITDINTAAPVSSPAVSLLVYNTNVTTGIGYYYWNGSQWERLSIGSDEKYLPDDPATSSVDMNDFEIQYVRALQGIDWDDDTGGADNKYRLLWRDGAHQFYNGGVVVGSYANGTWTDLSDGYLIVENRIGIGVTSPAESLQIGGSSLVSGDYYLNSGHYLGIKGDYNIVIDDANPDWHSNTYGAVIEFRGDNTLAGSKLNAGGLQLSRDIEVSGRYFDSNSSAGTSGQVLASTVSGTQWIKAQTIRSNSATVTAGNWYRIASNSGTRADASFTLRDQISGGGHSTMRFNAGVNYGDASGISFTLLSHSRYSTPTFTKVRIIENGTYDGAYLEVYCARSGSVSYDMSDNFQTAGWTAEDWTAGNIPSGWTAHEYETDRLFAVGASDDLLSLNRSGYLGLGVSNPTVRLDVSGQARIVNSTSPTLYLQNDAGSASNYAMQVYGQGQLRAFIAGNGRGYFQERLGIGTTSPETRLHVAGSVYLPTGNSYWIGNHSDSGDRLRMHLSGSNAYVDYASGSLYFRAGTTTQVTFRNDGNVGIGTTAPSEKLHVAGNAKANGYIVAGSATTTSTTRYGEQTIMWPGSQSVHGGTEYHNIGTFEIPDNIPAGTTIYVDRVTWESDAYHTDGDEDYSIHVKVGSSSYYGWNANAGNDAMYIDWHYDSGNTSITNFTTGQAITMRIYDDDPWLGGSDALQVYMMHVTVYYHYSIPLQNGDIAAAGRVYANNTTAIGDLAEHFEYDGPVAPGYVVAYVPGSDNEYEPCNEPYSNYITGVISENPSVVLNSPDQGPPVALTGRVKVKLVESGALIKGGDFVTSSDQPGLAQKATRMGPVIGYAVKNQKEGDNFVEILLQPGKLYLPGEVDKPDPENDRRKGKW